jgi:hypothetical protein
MMGSPMLSSSLRIYRRIVEMDLESTPSHP